MASSLEGNKITAAILTAGVIAMTSGFIAELIYHPQHLEENVYTVAVAEDEPAAGAEEEAAVDLATLLAEADVASGEKQAKKCTACHSLDDGGPDKVGPNLWDIVNRQIAGASGFGYSDVLQDMSGETWSYENLSAFLADPKGWAPGTKMAFSGIKKDGKRADLIAYLRSLSGSPAPLPE